MRCWAVLATLVSGCSLNTPVETQAASLGDLTYRVPAGWAPHETRTRDRESVEWIPATNERKESVNIIIITHVSPAILKAGPSTIEDLLVQAQTGFGEGAKASSSSRVTTSYGLVGSSIEVEFVPPGGDRAYHRTHGVLIDGDRLIHVIYTAVDPDLDTFSIVVNSLHHGEA